MALFFVVNASLLSAKAADLFGDEAPPPVAVEQQILADSLSAQLMRKRQLHMADLLENPVNSEELMSQKAQANVT